MKIGFNIGHSSELFLNFDKDITVTSFDKCRHHYWHIGKKYIDDNYPNRHTLIKGNSSVSVPNYINDNKNKTFDLIFIDGCHKYHIALQDIQNCKKLANENTIVIMDDTIYKKRWKNGSTKGPTQVWKEMLNSDGVKELGRQEYGVGNGLSWGKYNFT